MLVTSCENVARQASTHSAAGEKVSHNIAVAEKRQLSENNPKINFKRNTFIKCIQMHQNRASAFWSNEKITFTDHLTCSAVVPGGRGKKEDRRRPEGIKHLNLISRL